MQPSAVLRRATAQGLVRLDEAGVVTPGLASRWIALDEGRTLIFRLSASRWADGRPVVASDVRTQLRRQLASLRADPAGAALARAIEEVNAVTPAILEIRLSAERPDLLALLAQPAFTLTQGGGSGPWRVETAAGGWRTLARSVDMGIARRDHRRRHNRQAAWRLRPHSAGPLRRRRCRRGTRWRLGRLAAGAGGGERIGADRPGGRPVRPAG